METLMWQPLYGNVRVGALMWERSRGLRSRALEVSYSNCRARHSLSFPLRRTHTPRFAVIGIGKEQAPCTHRGAKPRYGAQCW